MLMKKRIAKGLAATINGNKRVNGHVWHFTLTAIEERLSFS
jgi:hypothetical protein